MQKNYVICIGWGSLIWDPRSLDILGEWQTGGPELCIEFARQSSDGRITLVPVPGIPTTKTFWVKLNTRDLDQAVAMLAAREGISEANAQRYVGSWETNCSIPQNDPTLNTISDWAHTRSINAVVWTALPPKFKGNDGMIPACDEVISYLNELPLDTKKKAIDYIRKTHPEIFTPYRQAIEEAFRGFLMESEISQ